MMYEQQQEQGRTDFRSGTRREQHQISSRIGIEEERLEIVDLSGLALESLPNPSLNLGIICKLDLSNNNLLVCMYVCIQQILSLILLNFSYNYSNNNNNNNSLCFVFVFVFVFIYLFSFNRTSRHPSISR